MRNNTLADVLERMHPNEITSYGFLMKLLKEPPNATEEWDAEDLAHHAQDMFWWMSRTRFSCERHPRLYSAMNTALEHEFFISLESMGYPQAATMSFFIKPKRVPLVVIKLNK
jgi:hypothetical protein